MQAYVNVRQNVVDCGGQQWPFELDCRAGTVSVTLGQRRLRLRRVSWREKRTLARFGHLGEQFIKTQFVRVALDGGEALPDSASECEALWALARWLNAPDGQGGLPLDQRLLASVTFDLCRTMHLTPAAFEDMEAGEVELLWQAAQGSQPQAAEESGASRILVLPDAPSNAPAPEPRPAQQSFLEPASGTQSTTAQEKARPPKSEVETRGVQVSDTNSQITKVAPTLRHSDETEAKPAAHRFRVMIEPLRTKSAPPSVESKNPGSARQKTARAVAESQHEIRFRSPAARALSPAACAIKSAAEQADFSKLAAAVERVELRRNQPLISPMPGVGAPADSTTYGYAPATPESDADAMVPDEWFDEFAQRLQEAARALGIDVEV